MDEITLTLPRQRDFFQIAHLVLGGLAVRLDLTLEHLEDLHIALDGVLPQQDGDSPITVRLRVDDGAVHAVVGPFPRHALRAELERDEAGRLGLRRLLDAVCDGVSVEERDDADWIELTKSVPAVA